MLELEEPSITPKMVDFLLQDGVCEFLLQAITQIGTKIRPSSSEGCGKELKVSYRFLFLFLEVVIKI